MHGVDRSFSGESPCGILEAKKMARERVNLKFSLVLELVSSDQTWSAVVLLELQGMRHSQELRA